LGVDPQGNELPWPVNRRRVLQAAEVFGVFVRGSHGGLSGVRMDTILVFE